MNIGPDQDESRLSNANEYLNISYPKYFYNSDIFTGPVSDQSGMRPRLFGVFSIETETRPRVSAHTQAFH